MKNEYIAYCGLNCESCEARLATINNDDALRRKVAAMWSELNGVRITPEMINCEGCRTKGVKTVFCESMCAIRRCASEKEYETCGKCPKINTCKEIAVIIDGNPVAAENLKE